MDIEQIRNDITNAEIQLRYALNEFTDKGNINDSIFLLRLIEAAYENANKAIKEIDRDKLEKLKDHSGPI